jgi:hypothetical protein
MCCGTRATTDRDEKVRDHALGQTAAGRYLRVIYVPMKSVMACLW